MPIISDGMTAIGNSSKTKNFIKSVSARPVDSGVLPSVAEFYSGEYIYINQLSKCTVFRLLCSYRKKYSNSLVVI